LAPDDFEFVPIDALVLVEGTIFGDDHGVLYVDWNIFERNELVTSGVLRAAKCRLDSSLCLNASEPRVECPKVKEIDSTRQQHRCTGRDRILSDSEEKSRKARFRFSPPPGSKLGQASSDFAHLPRAKALLK
jgi:hypothetical protein